MVIRTRRISKIRGLILATPTELEQQLKESKQKNRQKDKIIKEQSQTIEDLKKEILWVTKRLDTRTNEKYEWEKKYLEVTVDDVLAMRKAKAEYDEKQKKEKELFDTFEKQQQVKLGELGKENG